MTDLGGADRGSQRGVPVLGQRLSQRRGPRGESPCRAEWAKGLSQRRGVTGFGRGAALFDTEIRRQGGLRVPNPRVEVSGLKPRDEKRSKGRGSKNLKLNREIYPQCVMNTPHHSGLHTPVVPDVVFFRILPTVLPQSA